MTVAVFDTNVIVSGFLSPHGCPGRIVDLLRVGEIHAAYDDRIFFEYKEVLHRPEFDLPKSEVDRVLNEIASNGILADPVLNDDFKDLPDQADLPFAEIAASQGCPVVTGNLKHFPANAMGDIVVLSPVEYLGLLTKSES